MLISHNDPVKNAATEKPKSTTRVKHGKDETTVTRETTIQIKEEVKLSGKNKTGEIPPFSSINFSRPDLSNPIKVSKANSLVDQLVELDFDDKAGLVKKSGEFSKALEGMSNSQLIEVADYIRHLMQETEGTDDILGGLQETVFSSMKANSDPIPFVIAQDNRLVF